MARTLLASLLLVSLAVPVPAGTPLWRVVCDERTLEMDPGLAELCYGSKLVPVPPGDAPEAAPRHLPGILIPHPLRPVPGLTADRDIALNYDRLEAALKKELQKDIPGLKDLSDKWDEYRFLAHFAPAIAEPDTRLAADFTGPHPDPAEEARIQELARVRAAALFPTDPSMAGRFARLERVRVRAHAAMGPAILKMRDGYHSEGKLPRTTGDWLETYARYCAESKAKVDAVLSDPSQGGDRTGSVEEQLFNLPHIEGRTLDRLLNQPEMLILQAAISIAKEVRIHVVEGRVLEGTTRLRFHPLGVYLTAGEVKRVEDAVRYDFLGRLPVAYRAFAFTGDIALETSGKVTMLDLNPGYTSGYYFPAEDLIATNLLAKHFTGETTPVLEDFGQVRRAPAGAIRASFARAFVAKYVAFIVKPSSVPFTDRVLDYLFEDLARDPTPEAYHAALRELRETWVIRSPTFHQFIAWVQATWPELRLEDAKAESWRKYLDGLDGRTITRVEKGRLFAEAPKTVTPVTPPSH